VLVRALKGVQGTGSVFWPRGCDHRVAGHDAATKSALPHVRRAQPLQALLPPCADASPCFGLVWAGSIGCGLPCGAACVPRLGGQPLCHAWGEQRPRLALRGHRGTSPVSHFTYLAISLSVSHDPSRLFSDPGRSGKGTSPCPACPVSRHRRALLGSGHSASRASHQVFPISSPCIRVLLLPF
jgi:hypothetical protein